MLYSVLLENKRAADYVVLYPGRFQPFHYGHKSSYDHLVDQFGSDKVFIITAGFSKAVQSAQQKLKAAKLVAWHDLVNLDDFGAEIQEQLIEAQMARAQAPLSQNIIDPRYIPLEEKKRQQEELGEFIQQ